MDTYTYPEKLWNSSYILVLIVSTLSSFSFYMTATIMSKYLVSLGATIALAGVIVGLFSITSLVCRPFCGLMADRLNNIKLLIWSNVLMAIGILGFAVTDNMALIVLLRICNGVGFAISGTVQVALIVHFIPQNRTGEGIGYIGISQLIGSACAPAFGLVIADAFNMQMTFITAAVLPLLACVMLFFLRNLQPPKKENPRRSVRFSDVFEPKAIPFTLPYSTFSFVNGIIASYLVMFADERGIQGISIYFTIYAVCVFLVRPISGKLMDRKGLQYTVFPGMIITALSMFLLGRCTSLWLILLTGLLRAVGQGAAQPSLQAGCLNHVGRDKSGVATSTYYLGGDIGQGVGPMVGGAILTRIVGLQGYQFVFGFCGCLILVAMVYFYFVGRKEKF